MDQLQYERNKLLARTQRVDLIVIQSDITEDGTIQESDIGRKTIERFKTHRGDEIPWKNRKLDAIRQKADRTLLAGTILKYSDLKIEGNKRDGLAGVIPIGSRAISISVDATTASGGYIRPGDNVNILASASLSPLSFIEIISNEELRDLLVEAGAEPEQADDATGAPVETADETGPTNLASAIPTSFDVTQTILQNVQVLAVGDDTRPAPLETVLGWFTAAGLVVDRFLEPRPGPPPDDPADLAYWSPEWLTCWDELQRIPFLAVIRARRAG